MKKHRVPLHIFRHSLAVAELAGFLAEQLMQKGISVDAVLVDRAGLLHDMVRICDVSQPDYSRFEQKVSAEDKACWQRIADRYKGLCHEDVAFFILKDKYPELAEVIRRHKYASIIDGQNCPDNWEEKLVYYADKIVMHDKLVSLTERLEEGHKRNDSPAKPSRLAADIIRIDRLIAKLEDEILNRLQMSPVQMREKFSQSCDGNGELLMEYMKLFE